MRLLSYSLTVFVLLLSGWAAPLPAAPTPPGDGPAFVPTPALSALSPSTVAAGSAAFMLTVNGGQFLSTTVVSWNNNLRPTTYVSTTRLSAAIPAADVAAAGTFTLTAFTPGAGASNPLSLTVYLRHAHDTTADGVLGQPHFTSSADNNPQMPAANQLSYPEQLAIDARTGRLYVSDTNNNRVLSWPNAAAQANGQAADRVFGQNGSFTNTASAPATADSLYLPEGLAVDAQGRLYVADENNNRVLVFNTPLTSTTADRVFGQNGSFTTTDSLTVTADSLLVPYGLTLDGQGRLYVADMYHNRVLVYNTPLTSTTADRVFGQNGSFTTTDHLPVTANSLYHPAGVAVDAFGTLYVADHLNNRVLAYPSPLTTATPNRVFGQLGSFTTTLHFNASANSLLLPTAVAADAAGNLFVVEYEEHRVLEFNRPGSTDTTADRVFGQAGNFTTADPLPVSADSLDSPNAVALDAAGNVYVVDYNNSRVLEFDQPVPLFRLRLPLLLR